MKLICEVNEEVKILIEAGAGGAKDFFIEGVFMQGGIANKNSRLYSNEILDREVLRYNNHYIKENRAYGELGHPTGPTINLERVSHMIKSLHREGNDYVGKAKITDTPYGAIVKGLLGDGAKIGVSSRGMGSLKENKNGILEVQDDYHLATAADIVAEPSAPSAFVRGIMEGAEWLYDETTGHWSVEKVDTKRKALHSMTKSQRDDNQLQIFESFMNSLRKS